MEPGCRCARADAIDQVSALIGTYGLSGLVVLLSGAVWLEYYRKWLPLVVILAVTI